MKNLSKISLIATLLLPSFALAETLVDTVDKVGGLVGKIAPVLMGVAFAYFLYGVVKYIMAGSDETAKVKGKEILINGIIGLFVMVGVWGLVGILTGTFLGGNAGSAPSAPTAPGSSGVQYRSDGLH